MTLHKLTAGDGYTYLTRQVAALDSTEKPHNGLGEYYSQRGEAPGRWSGAALTGLEGMEAGQQVTEEQMQALFGEGRHPDAAAIEMQVFTAGRSPAQALAAASLGKAFPVFEATGNEFRKACAAAYGDYNARLGFPRDWPVPAADRSAIRTDVGRQMFTTDYHRPPADPRELAGYIARAGRPATTAVAGYDLTFSPVKSVSTLWALAPRAVSEQIEAAHHAAVADSLAWLERDAAYTRTGAAGVRQVDTTGLIGAVFTHRDSRAGDPDLHTHVAVSNKVQTADGRWLALDGRVLHKATVAASERYNTRLEAQLVTRLGIGFADRPGAALRKRPVREIVGVDERLLAAWSSRRAAIEVRRGELAARFQYDYGRPPPPIEALQLAQQATLETRAGKHEPRSLGQQRFTWRREATALIGGPAAVDLMVAQTLRRRPYPLPRATDRWVTAAADRVLRTVAGQRAVWQTWHVRAEAERQVRSAGIAPGDVDTAVTRIVDTCLAPARSVSLGQPEPVTEPAVLRRSDGASVYTVAGAQLFTAQPVIDAERALVAAAGRRDGRAVGEQAVELALLESAANGVELNPGQAQLVRELATSGARVQLAIAPAGSGKTTAMRVLARAWADAGGDVVGLAPSAVAAAGLAEQLDGAHCDTLATLTHSLAAGAMPGWAERIGAGTLVVVDEAGMAGTVDLAHAVRFVLDRGGSVRLVGDDQQLASVAAGGVLRDIAETHGSVTLSQLIRFHDPAEGAATLALRTGDPAGLGFYLDRGRVHVGDTATCADQAYTAWRADRAEGRDAVMLAPTRELVGQLNARARADRLLAAGGRTGRDVALADGNRASAGDVLISRRNDRTLPITSSDWVKNGDRWTVAAVHDSGAVDAVHLGTRRRVTLPAAYVRDNVDLGYASTVHGAQGITADACHTVATGAENRQLLYVGMTRGRAANHVYVAVAGDGDPHSAITPAAVRPPTATDILTGILGRDEAQRSAATTARELADPATRLGEAVARYRDVLGCAAEAELGSGGRQFLDTVGEHVHLGLTDAPAWPTLRARLALISLDGDNPVEALRRAAAGRELGTAADPAAVLDWRLDPAGGRNVPGGPLPWLPAIPAALAEH
ncbi:MAG: MobF family relaxase, partial [Mycobacteriales bacterium]